uniref:SHSP domain-containing protein n=2 Tax=Oryzias melastigma TaxID=30732 RepID=A0A3B3B5L6_ORYME
MRKTSCIVSVPEKSCSSELNEYRPVPFTSHIIKTLERLLMNTFQHNILEEAEPLQSSVALQPVSFQLDKDGQHFGLTLDTAGFSPEELSVRQVGRKLRVSGKTEKKQEDGKGSYSHRLQEFRQELDLPEGLNPEAVTCCLSPDGKLHIQAVKEEADRELSIKRSWEEEPQQRECSQTQDSTDSQHTIEPTQHMDSHTHSWDFMISFRWRELKLL